MKPIDEIKINQLSEKILLYKEMNNLLGGCDCDRFCTCSCVGSSSSSSNSGANYNIGCCGGYSASGCNSYVTFPDGALVYNGLTKL